MGGSPPILSLFGFSEMSDNCRPPLSKTVAYITYIVFQCSLSQGYVPLNRGFSGDRVCGYGSVFFHHEVSGGRGMARLTFFGPCTRVKVRVTLDASVQ